MGQITLERPYIASSAGFCIIVNPEYDDGRLTNCNRALVKHNCFRRLVFTLAQWLDRLVQTRTWVMGGSKEEVHKCYRIRMRRPD